MGTQAWLALGITALAFGLFVWNRFRPDVVALLTTTLLILTGLITPAQGLSGFANEATVTVALLLVLSTGLAHTGAVHAVGRVAVRLAGTSETRFLVLVLAVVVPMSALINNTAAVAILMPAVLGASRDIGVRPSRVLMPLSFASQLGGSMTLIGTSTNLLVAGLVLDLGLERIRIFDITPPALIVVAAGLLYLLTLGRWLTPSRDAPRDLLESYALREYLTSLRIRSGSSLAGRSISETGLGTERGLVVLQVRTPDGRTVAAPGAATVLRAGDVLLVEGRIDDIADMREADGVEVEGADPGLPDPRQASDDDDEDSVRFAEILVPPRSHAVGRSLRDLHIRTRYAVSIIGLRRHGEALRERLASVRLRPGDVLLAQGRPSDLAEIHESGLAAVVGPVRLAPRRTRKRIWAIGAMVGTVLLAALEIVPIVVSAMMGVLVLLLSRTVSADEAYEEMDWMVIILLGAIIPLGIALQQSGAAAWAAGGLIAIAGPYGPHALLAAIFILTTVLTNLISNVAAAALVFPIAAALAQSLGLSPTPFAVAVMFAASSAFLTPIGYQTNLFVYGPGGYRFSDFLRVGAPLTVITTAAAIFAIPVFLPFQP